MGGVVHWTSHCSLLKYKIQNLIDQGLLKFENKSNLLQNSIPICWIEHLTISYEINWCPVREVKAFYSIRIAFHNACSKAIHMGRATLLHPQQSLSQYDAPTTWPKGNSMPLVGLAFDHLIRKTIGVQRGKPKPFNPFESHPTIHVLRVLHVGKVARLHPKYYPWGQQQNMPFN